ncbi:MAG: DUF3099 domain-containing protein [Hamadaea sp.]|uniref:DUF3099 domain-containing protein n=1 Tax=Hamadaea sp. TaxID=2024425 RepID=UPI0017EAC70A|nr:DUF3099 domain-containing protein [Hamadaea sp.]NUR72510.1 DUF3099 domain-containing protein [Hamadaea sp.]NUT19690.1 DUF3099 domain-containing protein [Hamadaea sp.]
MARNAPILITDAEPSLDKQRHSREIRYLVMMSLRAVCLLLGSLLAVWQVPLLWLWLLLCGLGMVLLPWIAVMVANDRPVKPEHRWRHRPPAAAGTSTTELPTQPAGKTIDVEQ